MSTYKYVCISERSAPINQLLSEDHIEQVGRETMLAEAAPALLSALERTLLCLRLVLSRTPVRDVDETIAEAEAAIQKATKPA